MNSPRAELDPGCLPADNWVACAGALLREQPACSVPGAPELLAYQTEDVIALWERAERLAERQLPPPFWAVVWPGASLLARHILDHPQLVLGKRVLELGCGSGLCAVAAARAGAALVWANDLDAASLAAAEATAALNGVHVSPLLGDLCGEDLALAPKVDVILAAELFYDGGTAQRAGDWLAQQAAQGTQIWLADGGRAFFPKHRARARVSARRPANLMLEGVTERDVTVYEWLA